MSWSGLAVAILTVSDSGARGERVDVSGAELEALVRAEGALIAARELVPDEAGAIAAALVRFADELGADVALTTGGTGVAPRDVTPEATRSVAAREVPGIAEALRAASLARTPFAMLGRGAAAVRGRTLIVNLPGSPRAVRESFPVLAPVVPHAVALLRGTGTDHAADHAAGHSVTAGPADSGPTA